MYLLFCYNLIANSNIFLQNLKISMDKIDLSKSDKSSWAAIGSWKYERTEVMKNNWFSKKINIFKKS